MKNNQNEIIIPFSIFKHILLFLGAVAFVCIGFYMFFYAEPTRKYPEWSLKFWGTAGMLFFGLCAIISIILFFKRKKGVIINEEGIRDNTTIFSLELIKWEDIERIVTTQNNNIKQIHIVFKPEKEELYIKKIKNPIKRKLIEFSMKRFGYVMTTTMLKIKSDELVKLMRAEFRNYKKRQREISKKE